MADEPVPWVDLDGVIGKLDGIVHQLGELSDLFVDATNTVTTYGPEIYAALSRPVPDYSPQLQLIASSLAHFLARPVPDYTPQLQQAASCICQIPPILANRVGTPLDGINANIGRIAGQGSALLQAISALAGFDLGHVLGDTPDVPNRGSRTFVSTLAQAQIDAGRSMFTRKSPSPFELTWDDLGAVVWYHVQRAFSMEDKVEGVSMGRKWGTSPWYSMLGTVVFAATNAVKGFLLGDDQGGHADVDHVWDRSIKMYGMAAGLGVLAHGVSGILSTRLMGTLGMNFSGLAAVIGKFAGFDPIVKAVQGSFYKAYLDIPMGYWINSKLTPNIPDIGTLLELRYKSRASGKMDMVKDKEGFFRLLSYYGFAPEWCEAIEDHLYAEPRHFELSIMGESDGAMDDAPWLERKMRRVGYDEIDGRYMAAGLRRKQARRYIDGWAGELLKQVRVGLLTPEDFGKRLAARGFSDMVVEFATDQAREQWTLAALTDAVYELKAQFSRNEIDEEGLAAGLEGLGLRQERVALTVRIETLKRYHKVWRTTATEDARRAVSWYRTAFRGGLMTADRYMGAMHAAGMTDTVADIRMLVDKAARERAVVARLRRYRLPVLRDQLLSGKLTLGQYWADLQAENFPPDLLDAETGLARVLLARHTASRVERYELPSYERAYILGLLGRDPLVRVYREAGRADAEVAPRLVILDRLRAANIAAAEKGKGRVVPGGGGHRPDVPAAEWGYVRRELDRPALEAVYVAAGYTPDRLARRFAVLEPIRDPAGAGES